MTTTDSSRCPDCEKELPSARDRVAAGDEFLTDYYGTDVWGAQIDFDRLRLDDGGWCILGQLSWEFDNMGYDFMLGEMGLYGCEPTHYGFYPLNADDCRELEARWFSFSREAA